MRKKKKNNTFQKNFLTCEWILHLYPKVIQFSKALCWKFYETARTVNWLSGKTGDRKLERISHENNSWETVHCKQNYTLAKTDNKKKDMLLSLQKQSNKTHTKTTVKNCIPSPEGGSFSYLNSAILDKIGH